MFVNSETSAGMSDTGYGWGVAWGDYDNDGDLDLFVANTGLNYLYRNNGNGSFTNVAASAGLTDSVESHGASWGDYDNDGDLDLFIANNTQDRLYRNNGNGTFTDVATSVGMTDASASYGSTWGDYDADGDLDLFVANYTGQQDFLYKNNGNGAFTSVATSVGMTDAGNGFGANWCDYDADGDLDLFVSNNGGQDFLYRNNGSDSFTQVATTVGMTDALDARSVAWGDYDNDGDFDLYVSNPGGGAQDILYRNNGNGTFTEVATSVGMIESVVGKGAMWGDYDNDGDLDLYVVNNTPQDYLYRNNGNGMFTRTDTSSGMIDPDNHGMGMAWADYDADGDLDAYIAALNDQQDLLYRNCGEVGNWLKVKVVTDSNGNTVEGDAEPDRLAIGALVELDLNGGANFNTGADNYISSMVGSSDGLGTNAIPVHLGIGAATTVDVRVRFVDRSETVIVGVAANQTITVYDPQGGWLDTEEPQIVLQPDTTAFVIAAQSFWGNVYDSGVIACLKLVFNGNVDSAIALAGNAFGFPLTLQRGGNTIALTAEDLAGNIATCTRVVMLVDTLTVTDSADTTVILPAMQDTGVVSVELNSNGTVLIGVPIVPGTARSNDTWTFEADMKATADTPITISAEMINPDTYNIVTDGLYRFDTFKYTILSITVLTDTGQKVEDASQVFDAFWVTFHVPPATLQALPQSELAHLKLFWFNENSQKWVPVGATAVDAAAGTIRAQLTHFSIYAIFSGLTFADVKTNLNNVTVYPNPYIPDDGDPGNGIPFGAAGDGSGIYMNGLVPGTTVSIYDIRGRLVEEMIVPAGTGAVQWDVRNKRGEDVASGVYIATFESGGEHATRKIIVVR